MVQQSSWRAAFEAREDLKQYGDNAVLLFALALGLGIEDIDTAAAEALIDGSDDKKCDLVLVDDDRRLAIIAQGYWSTKERSEAPANKASDLNTAVSWLLARDINDLPERIRPAALDLRDALEPDDLDAEEAIDAIEV